MIHLVQTYYGLDFSEALKTKLDSFLVFTIIVGINILSFAGLIFNLSLEFVVISVSIFINFVGMNEGDVNILLHDIWYCATFLKHLIDFDIDRSAPWCSCSITEALLVTIQECLKTYLEVLLITKTILAGFWCLAVSIYFLVSFKTFCQLYFYRSLLLFQQKRT